jgi:vacuolar-type H+-ATPase subunit I/STV1
VEGSMDSIARPIEVIESEINFYKSQTASGIIEIGKRLIEAKTQLPHGKWGEWLKEKVEFSQDTARNFMRVAEAFPNSETIRNLSISKVYALLDVPEDQRENFVEQTPIEEMTTRQLQEAIHKTKQLEDQLEEEKNKPPKEVFPRDYELLQSRVEIRDKTIEDLKREMKILELKADANERDAEIHRKLKADIERLTREQSDIRRQISTATELSGLVAEAKYFFDTKLSPVEYSRAIREASEDRIVRQNLTDILDTFKSWIQKVEKYIYPAQYGEVIEMEVSDNE